MSGLLLFACFPLVNWSFLVWIAFLPLLLALRGETRLPQSFLLGYACGAVFFAGSCYWIVGVMEQYGGLDAVVSLGVLVLFVGLFSVFFGVFGLIETAVGRRSWGAALFLSPFLWVALEIARTYLFTGFPWNLLGYAVRPAGLEQLAVITGVYGLSFVAVATSALVAWSLLRCRQKAPWVCLLFWIVAWVAANQLLYPPPVGPEPDVAVLVQPDVPLHSSQLNDWVPWRNPGPLDRLVEMSVAASNAPAALSQNPPLVIWPENPAPFYFNRDPVFQGAMQRMARQSRAYVITGTVTFRGPGTSRPQNTAVILAPDGRVLLQYDKIHLVPFGEYVPWWAFPGAISKITSQAGDFVPGSRVRVAQTPEGTIGVFICYEAIFPQLVRRVAAAGAGVLVNISNDTWYDDSSAGFQHFEMARFRAIENRRFLLRATNDGITAIVDPYGRVQTEMARHKAGVLTGNFRYLTRETFYTAHGDVFAWVAVAIAAIGVLLTLLGVKAGTPERTP